MFDEPNKSKLKIIERGNQKSVPDNPDLANKSINKEDWYSHLIPLHDWVCGLGPHLQPNSQGNVDLKRLIWDSSRKRSALDLVLNNQTRTDDEAEVTFGTTKDDFKRQIYNLRASFSFVSILLALVNIKACFRFLRIHPVLTGAFGSLMRNFFYLAVAMVFGSNVSAPCWEPFCRAIEGLTIKIETHPDLVMEHKKYIDMIKCKMPPDNQPSPKRAKKCVLNYDVLDSSGNQSSHPAII